MATFIQNGIQFSATNGQKLPNKYGNDKNGDFADAGTDGVEPFINAVEIDWNSAELGTVNGINLGTINTTGELLQVIKLLAANINPASLLVLSSTSIEIIRPKGSLSSIAATGGSDDVTVNIGSTANITSPTSLTLTYGSNSNNSASTPTATYNGSAVTPVWSVKSGTCVSISGTTITATSAGTAVLEATYNNTTATCTVIVTNESTTSTIYSGWQYMIPDSSLASISGTTITGIRGGTTNVKVTYGGKQCDLSGTVRIVETYTVTYNVNGGSGSVSSQTTNVGSSVTLASYSGTKTGYTFAGKWNTKADGTGIDYTPGTSFTPTSNITLYAKWTISEQKTYYYYAGWILPSASNADTIINETYPASSSDNTQHTAGKKTTTKSSIDYTVNTLYNSVEKTNYYVLVPSNHAIYDSLGNNVISSTFTSLGTISIGNQIHIIYKSNNTSRNINSIIIQ